MWFTLKILGIDVLDITVGIADRTEPAEEFVSNTGGSFELAPESEPEWEESEEMEEDDTTGRHAPFGFRHA